MVRNTIFNLAIYILYYNCLIFMVAIQSHIVLILRLKQKNHSLADTSWINTPSEVPTYVTTFKMPDSDVTVTF